MTDGQVIALALAELARAREMYPDWPDNLVYAGSIVAEEAGELTKAINDYDMHAKTDRGHIINEAIQMIAMGVRFLVDTGVLYR